MVMMLTELYDALKSAGANEKEATEAAEAVAEYDDRLAKIKKDLAVLKWLTATAVSIMISVIVMKLFFV